MKKNTIFYQKNIAILYIFLIVILDSLYYLICRLMLQSCLGISFYARYFENLYINRFFNYCLFKKKDFSYLFHNFLSRRGETFTVELQH